MGLISGESGPSDKEGGGGQVIQTLRKGEAQSAKNIFSALRTSFCSKNKGGAGPPGPSPGSANAHVWNVWQLKYLVYNNTISIPRFSFFVSKNPLMAAEVKHRWLKIATFFRHWILTKWEDLKRNSCGTWDICLINPTQNTWTGSTSMTQTTER